MKKLNSFFLMGSVALAGLGMMSSCSSDDLGNDSTNITDNKAVKTQFALNIPRANGGTRMSAVNTQANNNFLGMEDILLYSFSEEPAAGGTSTDQISLAKTLATGDISSSQSSHIYSDVLIPVGTKYFLFYGHGPQGTTTAKTKFEKGLLTFTYDGNKQTAINAIEAKLWKIGTFDYTNSADKLIEVLNAVASVTGWADANATSTLGKLYAHFINLQAGSANSIRLALESLYNNVGGVIASGSSDEQTIANAIRTAIANVFNTDTGADGYVTLTYKTSTSNTYPNNINLPDGAVQVAFDGATSKFSYNSTASLTGTGVLDASKICFPSSIYYFCSSNLAATANELKSTDWPNNTTNWIAATAPWMQDATTLKTGWTDEVKPTTRSIAMRQNINYGVASLKTTVKCNEASLPDNTSFTDVFNSSDFPGTVAVPTGGFEVTGLLIGGQPTEVGFNFQPKTTSTFELTVYDNALKDIVAKYNVASDANYTIVLPNDKGRSATDQEKVNVAIELTNNSNAAFRGKDGIVPIGGKFYLVGELDPNKPDALTGVTNPAVFMSDYQTTLNLTIKSLANAYNTIPDLRSTKLQFGLSVDLAWKTGIEFNVDIN